MPDPSRYKPTRSMNTIMAYGKIGENIGWQNAFNHQRYLQPLTIIFSHA
jgi:hypothetical protein